VRHIVLTCFDPCHTTVRYRVYHVTMPDRFELHCRRKGGHIAISGYDVELRDCHNPCSIMTCKYININKRTDGRTDRWIEACSWVNIELVNGTNGKSGSTCCTIQIPQQITEVFLIPKPCERSLKIMLGYDIYYSPANMPKSGQFWPTVFDQCWAIDMIINTDIWW
jgi:hypothetical protein